MRFGKVKVYCGICGRELWLHSGPPYEICHSKEFGYLCNQECLKAAELKWARMILGHDDP